LSNLAGYMQRNDLDKIVENLLYIFPIFHKKLLKVDISQISWDVHLSYLHIGILLTIHEEMLPPSEIAKKFLISKPQMTHLINQLVEVEMVEKRPNSKDKRITDLTLTRKGLAAMNQCEIILKQNIKQQLTNLDPQDQKELALSIQNIFDICAKWQKS
jgi:DNA-binding MarR family transcriptional regulator